MTRFQAWLGLSITALGFGILMGYVFASSSSKTIFAIFLADCVFGIINGAFWHSLIRKS